MRFLLPVLITGVGYISFLLGRYRSQHLGPPKDSAKKASTTAHHTEKTEWDEPKRGTVPQGPGHNDQSSDKRQQRYERVYWVVTGIAAVFATAAAGGAAYYAFKAYNGSLDAIKVAQNTLVAGDRPWIEVGNLTITKIEVDAQGVNFQGLIKGTNAGHSPAQSVTVLPRLVLPETVTSPSGIPDPSDEIRKVCDFGMTTHVTGGAGPETVIFPGDSKPLGDGDFGISSFISRDDIENARLAASKRFSSDQLRTFPYGSWLILVGCVTYSYRVMPQPRQTSFAFYFWHRPAGSKQGTTGDFILTKSGTYLSDDVTVTEAGYGDILN